MRDWSLSDWPLVRGLGPADRSRDIIVLGFFNALPTTEVIYNNYEGYIGGYMKVIWEIYIGCYISERSCDKGEYRESQWSVL